PAPALATVSKEAQIVADAGIVFDQMLKTPGVAIPKKMLAGAEAVAIVPRVIKGGFIVGARYGQGVVITKDPQGVWHAPIFLSLTGGNVGWQAGVQSTDVVLVYRTQRSVEALMSGKLTIGADIAAAAGPVGRQAAAATDAGFTAEVYSYSRSRGLFAGVSLDGSVLKIDQAATAAYYRPVGANATAVPPAAQQLVASVVEQAEPPTTVSPPPPATAATAPAAVIGSRHALDEAASVRDQLSEFSPRLYRMLDSNWQQYLSLPSEVFQENGHPSPEAMASTMDRFDAVASNPNYQGLAARPEFQTVHGLLRHYGQLTANTRQPLNLPPPPQ
ncbi:unnamed protein product, partial [Ectocarpus sp. 4 AP-2014]